MPFNLVRGTKCCTYDDAGNLTNKNGSTLAYVSGSHRLNSVRGGAAYSYDANGNLLTGGGNAQTYTYGFNQPETMS